MTVEQAATGFVTVARVGDVEPGTVRVVELDGRSLCVGLTEDEMLAGVGPFKGDPGTRSW